MGTASSTYDSPFNLARRFASLDRISGGRAGWNAVTGFDTGAAGNFGLDGHLGYPTRYGRALEFVQVARGLWDSYEDDAFPADAFKVAYARSAAAGPGRTGAAGEPDPPRLFRASPADLEAALADRARE